MVLSSLQTALTKIVEVQKERQVEREIVTQVQLQISKINLKTEEERKEAILLKFNSLLKQDTSQMFENAKANRDKALQRIEKKLFPNNDEAWG